ncbi:sugar phosphate isomerase/epimerase family protein [Desulfurobacterium sp.]
MKITGHIPGRDIIENPERIERTLNRNLGIELQLTADVLEKVPLKFFSKLAEKLADKPVTFHAPFMDLNPGAIDKYVREATLKRFKELKPAAEILKPEVIVFHSGFYPRKVLPVYDKWIKNCVETFKEVCDLFPETKIAVENVFDDVPDYLNELLEKVNRKNMGICIDVGHLNIFSKLPLKDWLNLFADKIFEFHIHDNDGINDLHIAAGNGTFNFQPLFDFLKENRENPLILTLEAKTEKDQMESFQFLINNLAGDEDGNKNISR